MGFWMLNGGNGSGVDRPLIRFIAGKLTLNSDSRKLPFVTVPNRPKSAIDIDKVCLAGFGPVSVIRWDVLVF